MHHSLSLSLSLSVIQPSCCKLVQVTQTGMITRKCYLISINYSVLAIFTESELDDLLWRCCVVVTTSTPSCLWDIELAQSKSELLINGASTTNGYWRLDAVEK